MLRSALLCVGFILLSLNVASVADPQQQLPLVKADYSACVAVSPGPIARPDHYSTDPHRRRKDFA